MKLTDQKAVLALERGHTLKRRSKYGNASRWYAVKNFWCFSWMASAINNRQRCSRHLCREHREERKMKDRESGE